MANSASAAVRMPITFKGATADKVSVVSVTLDTVDSDLAIYSPAANRHAAIVGIQYAAATAHTLTIKTGANTIVSYPFPDNSGMSVPISRGILVGTIEGDDLVMRISGAGASITSMVVYILEYEQIQI